MAEWLGQFMQGWPTWAILAGIVVIGFCAFVVFLVANSSDSSILAAFFERMRRKNNGKK